MFRFEKFDVWQKAIDFADQVYSKTAKFPNDERFGLTSQMRRAAVSMSSNIAKGSSRSSDVDFARFLKIPYGSLMEVVSQAMIAKRQGMLSEDSFDQLSSDAERIARMLSGLRGTLTKKG